MATLTKYGRQFQKFVKANLDFIGQNTMLTHHLIESMERVIDGTVPLYNYFCVDHDDLHIACLHIEDEFLIFGNGFTEDMIELIDKEIDFSKFKRFTFSGNKEIIDEVFKPYNFHTEVIKQRIIYKCESVLDISFASGNIETAEARHLETLVPFGLAFSEEYYGFQNTTDEKMRAGTLQAIRERMMYLWVDEKDIVSMVQVLQSEEHDFPFIGFYYTPPQFRGKCYGTSLLHKVTKATLDNGKACVMLTADALNPASNNSFQKVGYKKVGEYIRVWKEKIS